MCDWTVLATNVPAERAKDATALWTVYRDRWQVELLLRRCKQRLGWSFSRDRTGDRVMTELLAKVLGAVVVLWAALTRGGPLCGVGGYPQGRHLLFAVVRQAWNS